MEAPVTAASPQALQRALHEGSPQLAAAVFDVNYFISFPAFESKRCADTSRHVRKKCSSELCFIEGFNNDVTH